jgi:hypothetical protein
MGKYDPLYSWLCGQKANSVTATFHQLEGVLGFQLPTVAMQKRQWWANEQKLATRHVQCRAWLDAGFKVNEVDWKNSSVEFVRSE